MAYDVNVHENVPVYLLSRLGRDAAGLLLARAIVALEENGDMYREYNRRVSQHCFDFIQTIGISPHDEQNFRFVVCDEWAVAGVLEIGFVEEALP